jgi:hypothetical protein
VDKIETEAGKKVEIVIKCERNWPEFKGAVTLIPLSVPNSVKVGTTTIAEGKTETAISLELQANMRPGEYTLSFTGQGQVPFAKDSKTARPNTLVPVPSRPLTLVVLPTAKTTK